MKNTEYSLDTILGTISSACPIDALIDLVDDMGLELVSVTRA